MKKLIMLLCVMMLGSSVMGAEMSQEDRKLAELQQTLYHAMINFDENQISLAQDKIMKYPVKRVIAGFLGRSDYSHFGSKKYNIIHSLLYPYTSHSDIYFSNIIEDTIFARKIKNIIWLLEEYDPSAINEQDDSGNTILHLAIQKRFYQSCSEFEKKELFYLFDYLVSRPDINIYIPNDQGFTVWDIVQRDPNLEKIKELFKEYKLQKLQGQVILPKEFEVTEWTD